MRRSAHLPNDSYDTIEVKWHNDQFRMTEMDQVLNLVSTSRSSLASMASQIRHLRRHFSPGIQLTTRRRVRVGSSAHARSGASHTMRMRQLTCDQYEEDEQLLTGSGDETLYPRHPSRARRLFPGATAPKRPRSIKSFPAQGPVTHERCVRIC